ncbi:MAG: SPOR domain-containing protein [Steroidobacteraceae bacterium]
MRTLALLLILANVGIYFWTHYVDVPEAMLSSNDVIVTANRAPPLLLARERTEQPAEVTAQISSELSCISVGPFAAAEQASVLAQRLRAADFSSSERVAAGEVFAGYWVSLQDFASKEAAEQVLTRLHASGVTDAYILNDEQAPNVLSLGLFTERSRAEKRRTDIAKLGFEPVIKERTRMGEAHWLDINLQEPGQVLDPTLLQADSAGILRLETRPCPVAAVVAHQSSSTTKALE